MIDEIYFRDDGKVEISAAIVGISRRRWVCANESNVKDRSYIDLMSNNKFDVLPFENDGEIKQYFITEIPNNYENIILKNIEFEDTIDLRTDIKNVIEKFNSDDRIFYFLTYQNDIAKLISLSNLNCRQVQIYIFQLLCDLERKLSSFLNENLDEEEILNWINNKVIKSNSENCEKENKYLNLLKNYESLSESNLDNRITEHFYFTDFFNIIKDLRLNSKLGLSNNEWDKYGSINEIRKRIAHPTRSLIDGENTIQKLSQRLSKIDKLIFILNRSIISNTNL